MVKKALLLFGLFHILLLIQSCCGSETYEYYSVSDLTLTNVGKFDLIDRQDSAAINWDEYAIKMNFDTQKYAHLLNGFRAGNAAYAFQCDEELFIEIHHKIVRAEVTSNVAIDSEHTSGELINELFTPYSVIKTCIDNGGSFDDDCAVNQLEVYGTLEEVLNKSFTQNAYMNLQGSNDVVNILTLASPPDYTGFLKFYVTLEFENGLVLTDSTQTVKFN